VRALDPATGQILWEQGLPSEVIGSLTLANGLLVVPDRSGLFVLHPGSGWVFYANDLGSDIYAQAIVAGGRLFLGDVNGVFHVFTGRHPPATVCSGRPTLRLRLVRGRSTLRLRHALVVPRGSAVSMASSRAMRLRITVSLAPSRTRRGATRTPGAALMYLRGL
jgi:PQQ-like domain